MTEPNAGEEWEFSGYIEGTNIPVHRRKYEASIGPVDFDSLVAEAYRRLSGVFDNERALPHYILDTSLYSMHGVKLYAIDIESPKPEPLVEPPVTLFGQRLAQQVAGGRGLKEENLLYIESKKEPKSHIVEAIKALARDESDVTIHRPIVPKSKDRG